MWRAVIAAAALAGCSQIFGLQEPQISSVLPDDAPPGTVRIGGTVIGLVGAGLVLENNGTDDDSINSDGAFVFPSTIPAGSPYDVTVSTQPTNPSQACTVASGSGTAATDVTDIAVSCATASYTVGGTVAGLNPGTQVMLSNTGTDSTTVSNGPFAFPMAVASGSNYLVVVTGQPSSGGPCSVFGGVGTVGNANVTTVSVNCSATMFAIGGSVSGLNGTVHLKNSTNGDTVTISANGSYAFPMLVTGAYNVTVTAQPTFPPTSQTCTVANGSGTASGNVTNLDVMCVTNRYSIGGAVTGLTGGTLVLLDNAGDDTQLMMSGAFQFATPIASGMTYAVTAKSQPAGLVCTLTNASGTVANANVTNVAAACSDPGVFCGGSYCPSGQACCDPEGMPHCQSAALSCKEIVLPCDDAAECMSGEVCCANLNLSKTRVNRVSCSTLSQCPDLVMCNPSVPSAPMCPSGTSCQAFGLLPGYYGCQ